jgi:hypothetical protein
MITDKFRRHLLASLAVTAMAAAIPGLGHAEQGGGEGRDSHDKTDSKKKEPSNPQKPTPKDFFDTLRERL